MPCVGPTSVYKTTVYKTTVYQTTEYNVAARKLAEPCPQWRGFRNLGDSHDFRLLSRAGRPSQQPRQMLLKTSLIRCSRASSSACSSSHSGVPRFGHGLVDRPVEPVMSPAWVGTGGVMSPALVGTGGGLLGVAAAGSGDTSWLTRSGCWTSVAIASCRDAQPHRLAPIPINRRAVSNRIIEPTIRWAH
jgi:hypothetical protein